MKKTILFFVSALSVSAISLPLSAQTLRHRIDFEPADEVARKVELPSSVVEATPRLVVGKRWNSKSHCSAAFISDSGHLLTAGHCLSECLPAAAYEVTESETFSFKSIRAESVRNSQLICMFAYNGVRYPFRVLAANWCSTTVGDLNKIDDAKAAIAKCESTPDFAILESPVVTESPACFPVSTQAPLELPVVLLGYPAATDRASKLAGAKDSTGDRIFASQGHLVNQGRCEVRNSAGLITTRDISELREIKRGYLQSTTDMVPGNSGGPLVSRSGQILGVSSGIAGGVDWAKEECEGMAFFTSIDQIMTAMAHLPSEVRDRAFRCEFKSVRQQP